MNTLTNNLTKKRISTIFLVWLSWCIGNLCANSLFFMGDHYHSTFTIIGDIIYFITIAGAGILSSYHYAKDWNYSFKPKDNTKMAWLYSIVLFIFIFVMGYFAMEEQLTETFTFKLIFSQSLWWLISPFFTLLPTMIAYTLLWYCLLLRTFEKSLKDNILGKIIAIVLSSFFYSIYHFASVNEIFTLSAIFDEILITFIISLVLGGYTILTNNLVILTIANLILNWFVFTPVESFHTTGTELLLSYSVAIVCIFIYILVYKNNAKNH